MNGDRPEDRAADPARRQRRAMPARSQTQLNRARLIDRGVAAAITGGGSLILAAVALLLVFLVVETLPLLRSGSLQSASGVRSGAAPLLVLEDEPRESAFVLGRDGVLRRLRIGAGAEEIDLPGLQPPLAAAIRSADGRLLAAVDATGTLAVIAFTTRVAWLGEERQIEVHVRPLFSAPAGGAELLAVAGDSDEPVVLLGGSAVEIVRGDGGDVRRLALAADGAAIAGALVADGSRAWVASSGQVLAFALDGEEDGPLQPLAAAPLPITPSAAAVLLGDTTLLLGDDGGAVTAWQLVSGSLAGSVRLERTARFAGSGRVLSLQPSPRDKVFAVLREEGAELVHLTARRVLLEVPELPDDVVAIAFSPRRDGFLAAAADGRVHRWSLELPHPEVSARTLFLPVRYEGYSEPELTWQTSGGSSGFEPKMSLVPLLVGTFKGAFYALAFSAPLALLAALYVSQFAPARVRTVAKPVVELMAALPSVVVGFLAALLLAPLLQRHLLAVLAAVALLPIVVIGFGLAVSSLPLHWRQRIGGGRELVLVGLLTTAACALAFLLEDPLAAALFGGDLEAWLVQSGVGFDQRNAVVVGFALGFAVIPIIFTLAEDAFGNVPPSLISASLALGASRWQAARTVAIPAASPGLFAAVMIGLGRAVGETMIVLMATGNTPILSLSPFNGMRTMSAAIAVEMPEAPQGSSLYRVLILTALLLFALTFVINTVAVLVSARLRRRFGRVAA